MAWAIGTLIWPVPVVNPDRPIGLLEDDPFEPLFVEGRELVPCAPRATTGVARLARLELCLGRRLAITYLVL